MEYKSSYYHWHTADMSLGEIMRSLGSAQRVLDLGCGTGWLLSALDQRKVFSAGVDLDLYSLQHATTQAALICASADNLSFASNSFDAIVVKDLLEHLLYPANAVREIHRLLTPEGLVWLSVPHAGSSRFYDDYTHIRPFTVHSLRSLLEDNGFSLESVVYCGSWPGVGMLSRLRGHDGIEPIVSWLASLGIRRQNMFAVARKQAPK